MWTILYAYSVFSMSSTVQHLHIQPGVSLCNALQFPSLCSDLLYFISDNFNMRSSRTKHHIGGERTPTSNRANKAWSVFYEKEKTATTSNQKKSKKEFLL